MRNTLAVLGSALLTLGLTSVPAQAVPFNYSNTTTGGPTFNRPIENASGLSGQGTAVAYHVFAFTVNVAGAYDFLSLPNTAQYDNFLILYSPSFNPAAGLSNFVIADDDTGGVGVSSAFSTALSTGTNYFLVTTGFNNLDFGDFSNSINGPGTVSSIAVVPEPATIVILGSGLAAMVMWRRRRVSLQ